MADHSPSEATALQISTDASLLVSTNIVHALVMPERAIPMFLAHPAHSLLPSISYQMPMASSHTARSGQSILLVPRAEESQIP
jgi:hypothetical protein